MASMELPDNAAKRVDCTPAARTVTSRPASKLCFFNTSRSRESMTPPSPSMATFLPLSSLTSEIVVSNRTSEWAE